MKVHPSAGLQPYQCRQLAFGLGLNGDADRRIPVDRGGAVQAVQGAGPEPVEVNPLIVTKAGKLVALDGKINFDDNAEFRHPDLAAMRDAAQEDPPERRAGEHKLNYVTMDGDIGCMVNGAGLAMATMDVIKLHGGEPANFLDVGGGATKERVTEAFKLILSSDKVRASWSTSSAASCAAI